MRRIPITLWLPFAALTALAGCTLPGRPGPYANAPTLVDVAALTSFDGRVPLLTIPEGTTNWGPSVKYAVTEALKIKPDAHFRVYITGPARVLPIMAEREMSQLAPDAALVADAILADGAQPGHVSLGGSTDLPNLPKPATLEIVVFAK